MRIPIGRNVLLLLSLVAFVAVSQVRPAGQAPAPARGAGAAAPLPIGTDPDEIAANLKKIQHGPLLPHKYVASWPQMPKGHNFGEGTGVGIDPQGNVWVANRGAWPIMQFDRAGKLLQSWNTDTLRYTPGVGRGIHGIKPDLQGNVWTTDREGSVIHKYSPEGKLLAIFGNRQGNANGNESKTGFDQPTNFWPLPNGNMLISDGYGNGRVVEVTTNGKYVRHIGRRGTGDGEFNTVHGVTADSQGRIYIADRGNFRIQVFDKDGKFLTKWTDVGQPWDIYYVAKENAIYMADGWVNRIVKLNMDGKVIGETSQFGKGPGDLDYAHAIAVSADGADIYVAEIKNWRIQKWSTRP